jgi:hypothetical protein
MKRPPFEVADIIRAHGDSFVEKSRAWLTWLHLRVLSAIEHCRNRVYEASPSITVLKKNILL